MEVCIFTAGGTIDKIYFDANSEFQVGEPAIELLLRDANVNFSYRVESLMRKDSLEMTDEDRALIRARVQAEPVSRILVTHGTDTMVQTAKALLGLEDKTILLTGSMQPARLQVSDAIFNIGFAMGALKLLPCGVYIAINGEVFEPEHVQKNWQQQRFEKI